MADEAKSVPRTGKIQRVLERLKTRAGINKIKFIPGLTAEAEYKNLGSLAYKSFIYFYSDYVLLLSNTLTQPILTLSITS